MHKFSHDAKRAFEIFPGALTWTAIIAPIVLAKYFPFGIAIFVIIFDLYWFFRSVELAVNIIRAHIKMKRAARINWAKKLTSLNNVVTPSGHCNNDVYQAIIIVAYKEPLELLELSIKSYINSIYDTKKHTILILGTEDRAGDCGEKLFKRLSAKFADRFLRFEHAIHPENLPGEIKCKSAHATFAAKHHKT